MSDSSSTVIPMRGAVLASLLMTWAWGAIAGSIGLYDLVKSNQVKSHVKKLAHTLAPTANVSINTNDSLRSGIVLIALNAFIALICTIFILLIVFSRRLAVRTLRFQSLILAFCAAWLLATSIPLTYFFATRGAKVTATIDGVEVSPALISTAEKAVGFSPVYRHTNYARWGVVMPWITFLFAVIASVVLFKASSRSRRTATLGSEPVENKGSPVDEK